MYNSMRKLMAPTTHSCLRWTEIFIGKTDQPEITIIIMKILLLLVVLVITIIKTTKYIEIFNQLLP